MPVNANSVSAVAVTTLRSMRLSLKIRGAAPASFSRCRDIVQTGTPSQANYFSRAME
jgi:hypothetical protein